MSDADDTMPKDATEHTRAANRAARDTLPLNDRRDYEDAARGFVGAPADPLIRRADGVPVLDLTSHDFVDASDEAPDTVHPSLWRHAQVNNHHGLFEVAEGVYQLRGIDLANITIVEGETGIIVIDPLSFAETARAALALYREHRGDRPVTGLVYTHSHVDHFSGSRAIVEDAHGGDFPVIAPEGFLYEAAAENVYAGTAMTRRALYMYGPLLAPGPRGQVDAGLANTLGAGGSATLVPPTDLIRETGAARRRGRDDVPDGAGNRGARRVPHPLPGAPPAVRGGGRQPPDAQPVHPARRAGAGCGHLVEDPQPDDRAVRR